MRISDWSSDVCSSDLRFPAERSRNDAVSICKAGKAGSDQRIAIFAISDELFALAESLCAVHKDHAFQASSPKLKAALRGGFFFRHPLPWMARHTIGDSLLGKLLICRSACGPARPAIATPARGPDKDAIRVAAP